MELVQAGNAGLSLLIAAQALFLTPLILARRERRTPANIWLAGLLFAFFINNAMDVIGEIVDFDNYPPLLALNFWLIAPLGPLALSHIATALPGSGGGIGWRAWWPTVTMALLMSPWLFLSGAEVAALSAQASDIVPGPVPIAALLGALLSLPGMILYLGWCLWRGVRLTAAARSALTDASSDRARLEWLTLLTRCLLVMWGVLVLSLLSTLAVPEWEGGVAIAAGVAYLLAIYGLSAVALCRPEFLTPPAVLAERVVAALTIPTAKYRKSALTAEDSARLLAKPDALMRREMLWRDSRLTLPQLAAGIGATPNDLSQALNEGRGVSFFDYVNGLRIDAVKAALRDPAQGDRSVLDLALDAGFNSKSAFNAAFKKLTGLTPSAYRAGG